MDPTEIFSDLHLIDCYSQIQQTSGLDYTFLNNQGVSCGAVDEKGSKLPSSLAIRTVPPYSFSSWYRILTIAKENNMRRSIKVLVTLAFLAIALAVAIT